MIKILRFALPILFLTWSSTTHAIDLYYTYLQGEYISHDDKTNNLEFTGLGITGSFNVDKNIYVITDYISLETDDDFIGPGITLNENAFTFGFGYITPIAEGTHVTTSLAYVNNKLTANASGSTLFSDSGNGYNVAIGLRVLSNQVEINPVIKHEDVEGFTDDVYDISLLYHFQNGASLGASYSGSDEWDSISLLFRSNYIQ